jgi:NAD-dependent DNA ligase
VLEEKLIANGWTISDSLTKKTSMLIVSDEYDGSKTTGKAKKAVEYGVPISRVSEFRKRMVC